MPKKQRLASSSQASSQGQSASPQEELSGSFAGIPAAAILEAHQRSDEESSPHDLRSPRGKRLARTSSLQLKGSISLSSASEIVGKASPAGEGKPSDSLQSRFEALQKAYDHLAEESKRRAEDKEQQCLILKKERDTFAAKVEESEKTIRRLKTQLGEKEPPKRKRKKAG